MTEIRKAPKGLFRVVGKDSPTDEGWKQGDYPTLTEAKQIAQRSGHVHIKFRVYNDAGECVHGGSFI